MLSPAWLGSIHVSARTDTAPAATPTGIDYLHLVEDRHLSSLGERLRYAQLADPTAPSEPTEANEPAGAPAAHRGPPPDRDGLPDNADLLALTGDPAPGSTPPAPDPALEAELASLTHPEETS